jgi:CRISPR-associated protein Cas2
MLMLITYDVSTITPVGRRRLSRVAKLCEDYGIRVQNSVFECHVDAAQWADLRGRLLTLVDADTDSLRFYRLGNHWRGRVEHVGAKPTIDVTGSLVI